jgi:hypothetical protein
VCRVGAEKEKRITLIQRNSAAWIALYQAKVEIHGCLTAEDPSFLGITLDSFCKTFSALSYKADKREPSSSGIRLRVRPIRMVTIGTELGNVFTTEQSCLSTKTPEPFLKKRSINISMKRIRKFGMITIYKSTNRKWKGNKG